MTEKKQDTGQILTVNAKGLFIEDKPTKTYNGEHIDKAEDFAKILGKDFLAVQIMQSDTVASYAETGDPKPDDMGLYTWVRIIVDGGLYGIVSKWMRNTEYTGYPIVAKEPFQSTQDQMRHKLQRNILTDAFVLQSTKRPELRNALLKDVEKERKEWKSDKELSNIIATPFSSVDKSIKFIREKLLLFKKKYPRKVGTENIVEDEKKATYFIHREYIKKFCEAFGLYLVIPFKTKNWKNAAELVADGIKVPTGTIDAALKKLADDITKQIQTADDPDLDMLEWVQIMLNPETYEQEYCLNAKYIKDFKAYLKNKKITDLKRGQKVIDDIDDIENTGYGIGGDGWSR